MPRILYDTTRSRKIDQLPASAEVLFYRLLLVADDYGNFPLDYTLIKSYCYPLKSTLRTNLLIADVAQLVTCKLLSVYQAAEEKYLHIEDDKQSLRWPKAKYPLAPGQVLKPPEKGSDGSKEKRTKKEKKRREEEEEVEEKRESDGAGAPAPSLNNIKKNLYEIGVHNFQKYFPREAATLKSNFEKALSDYNNAEIPKAAEKELERKFVKLPLLAEIEKFVNYYFAEIETWNQLKLSSKFFVWLDRKMEYERNAK